ncbi:hypothetical protein DPMN_162028 [Dreissena polymorpha]|uniref:Uncharacterized protein n=1 Tax=Dreissena polymorpha TaxID=45954 RepID=A0A9D4EPK7_DREPO|nr:hypothetical protein DPMN_162028 [Dreissena polymorpha]
MMIMTAIPDRILGRRLRGGKYGSLTRVIGFSSYVGALAAYSGRGRSCEIPLEVLGYK